MPDIDYKVLTAALGALTTIAAAIIAYFQVRKSAKETLRLEAEKARMTAMQAWYDDVARQLDAMRRKSDQQMRDILAGHDEKAKLVQANSLLMLKIQEMEFSHKHEVDDLKRRIALLEEEITHYRPG